MSVRGGEGASPPTDFEATAHCVREALTCAIQANGQACEYPWSPLNASFSKTHTVIAFTKSLKHTTAVLDDKLAGSENVLLELDFHETRNSDSKRGAQSVVLCLLGRPCPGAHRSDSLHNAVLVYTVS